MQNCSMLFPIYKEHRSKSLSDEIPNAETLEAMEEVQAMIDNGKGEHFDGATSDFLDMLLEE